MIELDFTTDNPRWGISGILFQDKKEYSKTLGFLTNIRHYISYGNNITYFDNSISIHIEGNYIDGAWAKECRIHYYKGREMLNDKLHSLSESASAGRGDAITCRINSNKYIKHLIEEYNFEVKNSDNYIRGVIPSDYTKTRKIFLKNIDNYSDKEKEELIQQFEYGFNL